MNRTRLIVLLGSFVLAGLAALAWSFALAPRLNQPAEIRAQTESVHAQTSRLESEIVQLTAAKDQLPAQVAWFEKMEATFPSTAEMPAVLDQIRTAASEADVAVQGIETSAPTLVATAADEEAANTGAEGEAAAPVQQAGPTAEGSPESVGLPAAVAASDLLATMPMSVTVKGSYADLSVFLEAAEGLPRAWLIDTLEAQRDEEKVTEITLTASGTMFVLDTTRAAVPDAASNAAQ